MSSRRLTRPVRAAGRLARGLGLRGAAGDAPEPTAGDLGSWLRHFHGERLAAIDEACRRGTGPERYALFRELDDDAWALLLTQQYELYPAIRALLPDVPEPALQELWNGRSGVGLASQSRAFYAALRDWFARLGAVPLAEARVLDFGCGWGRLTRFLARDVAPGALFGCDPLEGILDVARTSGVPAILARSEFRPRELPFEERFDLAFAFSVFTHLSEPAHEACLDAVHGSLAPGGVLVLTVRPPAYLERCEAMHPLLRSLGPDPDAALGRPHYLFVPHETDGHLLSGPDGRMDFGETFVSMAYVRERWTERFELAGARLILEDPYQVTIALRRR